MSRFSLSRVSGAPASDEELLSDLRRVAEAVSQPTISIEQYRRLGNHDRFTVTSRFGSWKKALAAAGLGISKNAGISDEILFENILRVWQHHGRQPRRGELSIYPSTISQGPYWRRVGGWTSALERFVEYANAAVAVPNCTDQTSAAQAAPLKTDPTLKPQCAKSDFTPKPLGFPVSTAFTPTRRSPRDPGLRLRFKVLQRDNFSCRNCGRSSGKLALSVQSVVCCVGRVRMKH